jgi:large conductance mechanosensitive channel
MAANKDSISAWPAGSVIVALINVLLIAIVMVLIGRGIEARRRSQEAIAPADPQAQLASAATRLADNLDRRQL